MITTPSLRKERERDRQRTHRELVKEWCMVEVQYLPLMRPAGDLEVVMWYLCRLDGCGRGRGELGMAWGCSSEPQRDELHCHCEGERVRG